MHAWPKLVKLTAIFLAWLSRGNIQNLHFGSGASSSACAGKSQMPTFAWPFLPRGSAREWSGAKARRLDHGFRRYRARFPAALRKIGPSLSK